MAKRIRIFMPNGLGSISIWDNQLDKFLAKGYTTEVQKKTTRTSKKKDVEVEQEQSKEGANEWQHMSEQVE